MNIYWIRCVAHNGPPASCRAGHPARNGPPASLPAKRSARFQPARPALCFLLLSLLILSPAFAEKFYPDDPIHMDADQAPGPKPAAVEISQIYDLAENSFIRTRQQKDIPKAVNINTLGEVPDSSWFTNRIGARDMTMEELLRGPNQVDGPDASGPWTITRAKSEGISPGFTIKDARGDTYFLKFDPLKHPQLATSAEVICTKFFHAFGYSVPENYLVTFRPEMLRLSPDAIIKDDDGQKRAMTEHDINAILKRVPLMPDGTIQAVGSRLLPGEDLGHFKYWGTRSDDPNDVFPHQDRRELRGLHVFAAWLNHDDSRSINSLDIFVKTDGDSGYVKHYLIDFGSTLGSGSVQIQGRRAGNEYLVEWGPIAKAGVSFGLWDRFWRSIPYPDYPSIGRYESKYFRPEAWRPEYPNPAFDRMQNEDAFWAVRIVRKFTDEMVREIVGTGKYVNPLEEKYLADTIIERRDRIVRYYLGMMNPLDNFRIAVAESTTLSYENLAVSSGLPEEAFSVQWYRFNNESGELAPLGEIVAAGAASVPVPEDPSAFLMARFSSGSGKIVDVYLRNDPEISVVGIERK